MVLSENMEEAKKNPRYDMYETKIYNDDSSLPITCADKKCVKKIEDGDVGMVDLLSNKTLCKTCGSALRYHRKMAHIRKENYKKLKELDDAE